jgi:hypothetical protein
VSELHRKLFGNTASGALPPRSKSIPSSATTTTANTSQSKQIGRKRDYSPISWSIYFDTYRDIVTDENNHFRVYVKGNEGPVIFFLHGGMKNTFN